MPATGKLADTRLAFALRAALSICFQRKGVIVVDGISRGGAAAGASVLCTRAAMSSAICSVAAGRLAASDSSDISRRRSSSSSHPHTVEAMVLGSPE